jgi:archaellum component FlaC
MGFGSTAKKLQKVTDMADKLYERFERLREQVNDLTGTVEETNDRVAALEAQVAEQRAILEEIADQDDIDVEEAVANAETAPEDAGDGGGSGDAAAGGESADGNA